MYIKDGVIQKVISEYSYNIITICKKIDVDIVASLQDYIKEVYLNYSYLTSAELYSNLSRVIIEVCSQNQIEAILTENIPNCFSEFQINSFAQKTSISYDDLCNMLINRLIFLQVRTTVGGESVDLFYIDVSGRVMSMTEYDEEVMPNNKDINKVLKKK